MSQHQPAFPIARYPGLALCSLHFLIVWNFAVTQPLFDLLSRHAEFFVIRQSAPLDIILFVVLLSIVFPALGVLVVWGIRVVHVGLSVWLHLLLVGCLSAMLALQALLALQGSPYVSGIALLLAAGGMGLLASVVYHALSPVRTFCTLLSPGIVLFPPSFSFSLQSRIFFFLKKKLLLQESRLTIHRLSSW